MLFEPDLTYENAVKIERLDSTNLLSSCSDHPILLEQQEWKTCEHYYSYKIVRSAAIAESIKQAATGQQAYELASPWYRYKVPGWKKMRTTLMMRALFTKVQMYPEVREALLATGDNKIIESSQYDYFWGVGRDMRGGNQFGKIWMDIRTRIGEK